MTSADPAGQMPARDKVWIPGGTFRMGSVDFYPDPRVTSPDASHNVGGPGEQFPRMVVKGGSHLCAPNYCHRYRPAARSPQTIETSMGHLSFRCIVRPAVVGPGETLLRCGG